MGGFPSWGLTPSTGWRNTIDEVRIFGHKLLLGSTCIIAISLPKKTDYQKMVDYFDRLRLHGQLPKSGNSRIGKLSMHTDVQPWIWVMQKLSGTKKVGIIVTCSQTGGPAASSKMLLSRSSKTIRHVLQRVRGKMHSLKLTYHHPGEKEHHRLESADW